ncbi:lamin tail domain-containing protein [bacterium]|jgi:hypothetical protein|nr:lamin tail domain-containing protein [bacterium]MBT4292566.1 lamin tail domain-containing protein [bacterium]MBT7311247.1 lamin tail domain-containing protein [bacterium]
MTSAILMTGVEIYNATDEAVDVGGYYITDDLEVYDEWQIPTGDAATIIPAGGYLVLFADEEPEQGALHVNIKLSGGGEAIGLYNADGVTIDEYTFGEQVTDVSEGRETDGALTWVNFVVPTPGATNN